jgi:uncharacterized OB-fold protein
MTDGVPPIPPPERTAHSAPYWDALDAGRHVFERCAACGHAWLPPRAECPRCLSDRVGWETASGQARLISWVVYHAAFHPAFAARLPYTVAVVELREGPRLISNIVGVDDPETLEIEMPLRLVIERENGFALPRYTPDALVGVAAEASLERGANAAAELRAASSPTTEAPNAATMGAVQ